jgi:hypothetical protein
MEILLVAGFYTIVFAGILILRRMARADADQWHPRRR